MRNRLTAEAGMSLIEATVVLAVAAMLSAVMAPAVRNYVQSAQQSAAKKDVEAIGAALEQFLVDTGEAWFVQDGNGATATDAPARTDPVELMVTAGKTPAVLTARGGGLTDWDATVDNALVQLLDLYLVENSPSDALANANAYRSATNMSVAAQFDPDSGAQFNSEHAWRGPYVPGPISSDPWGFRYAVNVEFLVRAAGAGPSGSDNDVVVISAGDDGMIEPAFAVDGVTSGNDVFYVLSGGTR